MATTKKKSVKKTKKTSTVKNRAASLSKAKKPVKRSTAKPSRTSATSRAGRSTPRIAKKAAVAPVEVKGGKVKKQVLAGAKFEMKGKSAAKVESLIKLGRERGYITFDEILREFPTIEDDMTLLEEMYERFSTAGIDVLEGGGMLEDTGADSILASKKLQNRRADASYDSVQMYLMRSVNTRSSTVNKKKPSPSAYY